MKSLLSLYKKVQNQPLEDVLKKLKVDEDRLYALLTSWVNQGHLTPDNQHINAIKTLQKERKEAFILYKRREKLQHYQNLRDSGFSLIHTAELMHLNPDRLEAFYRHEIERMMDEGVSQEDAAHILRISPKHYKKLYNRIEAHKRQQQAAQERRLKDNRLYAQKYLAMLRNDLANHESNVLIFDLEAVQQPDEIIEISMIDIHGNVLMDQLVQPSGFIKWHIVKLTGITNAMVQNQPNIHEVMPQLKKITAGKTLLSWGNDYDTVLIRKTCAQTGMDLNCELGCAQKIHMGFTDAPNQMALSTAAGVSNQNHRALDDCLLVKQVLLDDIHQMDLEIQKE